MREFILKEHEKFKQNNQLATKEWNSFVASLEEIANKEQWDTFLSNRMIKDTMCMAFNKDICKTQLDYIFTNIQQDVALKAIQESSVGSPSTFKVNSTITSSANTVHHCYHLSRYIQHKGMEFFQNQNNFIEWGGGYGNFCRIINNLKPNCTYTIIDLPMLILVQYNYLTKIFGEESVNVVKHSENIVPGKINLVCSTLWESIQIKADLMISTWALSESPIEIQNKVFDKQLFSAYSGLFAFHQCGDHIAFMNESTHLKEHLLSIGYSIEDMTVIPGINHYAFI